MKLLLLLILPLTAVSCSSRPTDVPVTRATINDFLDRPRQPPPLAHRLKSTLFPNETERAFRLERAADIVVSYDTDGLMRIDNTPTQSSIHVPDESRPPSEWIGLFDRQPGKSMVVVIVAKNVWEDDELARHLSFLNRYFVDRGYARIVIQQARGNGRPTHSDITVRAGKEIHFTSSPGIRRGLKPISLR